MSWFVRRDLAAHNAKFDSHICRAGLRKPSPHGRGEDLVDNVVWDSQIVQVLLDPLENSSLKPTAQRLNLLPGQDERVNEVRLKQWLAKHCIKDEPRYDLAPWDVIAPYADVDAILCLLLSLQQMDRVDTEIEQHLVDEQFELMRTLYRMECRGIGFDRDQAARESAKLQLLVDDAARDVKQACGGRAAPTEHSMRNFWFGSTHTGGLGLKPIATTPKGAPQVTKDVVRVLTTRGVQGAPEWERYQRLSTAQSMWYGNWWELCGDDGRLRTSYRQMKFPDDRGRERGTVSGRLAVERVQLQAIPHDYQIPEGLVPVRRFFRARPGHQLWEFDISQAEGRCAAAITGCESWISAFAAGSDMHSATATAIFEVEPGHPDWDARRAVAKRLVLGTLYGAGAARIQEQIRLFTGIDYDLDECKLLVARFRRAVPEITRYSYRAQSFAERWGYVELINGRRRWFTRYEREAHEERKAFNAEIQGGVAVGVTYWMNEVETYRPGALLCQIHDSLVCELPDEHAERWGAQIQRAGERTFENLFGIPFAVDAKRWDKD
jgi:DNA polymerase-1